MIPEDLFSYHADPPAVGTRTSQAAAESAKACSDILRRRIWMYLNERQDGATDEQMQLELRIAQNTQRPRRVELVRMGLVHDSGSTRPTASGRSAIVWKSSSPIYKQFGDPLARKKKA